MTFDVNNMQGELGLAHVRAVAISAGLGAQESGRLRDLDGVDLELFTRGAMGIVGSPCLHLQVKSLAHKIDETKKHFAYSLPVKSYDELRATNLQVPRLLVIVLVPMQPEDWVVQSEQSIAMKFCGYYHSLRGAPQTSNTTKIKINIERKNVLDKAALQAIFQRLAEGRL